MDQYKQRIEAIVHPLRASEWRKNTLRRELWSHFCALVEEHGVGLEQAFKQLGTPTDIQQSFCASASRAERLQIQFESLVRRRIGETVAHYALRYVKFTLGTFVPLSAFIVACVYMLGGDFTNADWRMGLIRVAIVAAFLGIWLFPVLLHMETIESRFRIATIRRYLVAETFRFALALAVTGIPLGIAATYIGYVVTAHIAGAAGAVPLEFLYVTPGMIAMVWFQWMLVFPLAFMRSAQIADPIADWPYAS